MARRPCTDRREARAARRARGDEGSVLILAFVYLVAVSVTVSALANWAINDLHNTPRFSSVRELQLATTSTAEFAMQSIRYTPELSASINASPPVPCWGSGTSSGLSFDENGITYSTDVWCSTVWNPTSADTRVVTFSACADTLSAAKCAANPYLQAVVTFDDYPPGGAAAVSGPCTDWGWCGQGQTIDSWTWA